MYGAKSTYTKNQRPHGNTSLGLEGKPTNRINKTAVRPSIEPRSNTAWQHHLNDGGGWRRRREGPELVGSHFFGYVFSLFHFFTFFRAAHLCVFTFFTFFHFFHLFSLVCFRRFQPFLAKNSEFSGFCSTPRKKVKTSEKMKKVKKK